jgi:hypothetical protein
MNWFSTASGYAYFYSLTFKVARVKQNETSYKCTYACHFYSIENTTMIIVLAHYLVLIVLAQYLCVDTKKNLIGHGPMSNRESQAWM